MKNSHVVIIGGGNVSKQLLNQIQRGDYIISVDRAAIQLIRMKIIPDIAIGDFDSVTEKEFRQIERYAIKTIKYPAEKDETDLELAIIYSIGLHSSRVTILGATGKRLDHELSSIYLLKKYLDKGIKAEIIDTNNKITLIDKKTIIHKDKTYTYLSLIPYTQKAEVSIKGCAYTISKTVLYRESSRGVSNEITDSSAEIEVHEGAVILIQSRD